MLWLGCYRNPAKKGTFLSSYYGDILMEFRHQAEPRLDTTGFMVILACSGLVPEGSQFMKRQYQPKKMRRKRQHGFLARKSTRGGRATLRNRRRNGRKRLTPV